MPGATLTTSRAGQAPDGATSLRIADVRWHKGRPMVGCSTASRRSRPPTRCAATACGLPASARPALEPGHVLRDDLVGCRVETMGGRTRGRGRDGRADRGRAGRVGLVVETPQGEVLVPLADDICPVIDPDARRIVIDPPAGLLELNAPPATPRPLKRGKGRSPQ